MCAVYPEDTCPHLYTVVQIRPMKVVVEIFLQAANQEVAEAALSVVVVGLVQLLEAVVDEVVVEDLGS